MPKSAAPLLLLAYLAFVSLGLPDTVLGVAWPSLRVEFGISQAAIGSVLASGVSGYFLSGLLAGSAVRRVGVGVLLTISSGLVALALLGYALAPSWYAFVAAGFFMGIGSGAIDSGLNGYAARHFSVRHVNWLHACWGVGATAGPALMTVVLARELGYRAGYALLAGVLSAMALAFVLTRRSWDGSATPTDADERVAQGSADGTSFGSALKEGRVWLQIATFFVYTGLEATLGQWCFSLLREGRGLGVEAAGAWTAAYWGSLTFGRVALGFVVDRWGPDRLLRGASVAVMLGALIFTQNEGLLGRLGLLVTGFGLAPVYPTLMARTPARLGAGVARHAVGFQASAGMLGMSLIPALVGVLVGRVGIGAISLAALGLGVTFLVAHEIVLRTTPRCA